MKLTGDDSPLIANFVRSGKEAKLRLELATLRKRMADRETVEGWLSHEGRALTAGWDREFSDPGVRAKRYYTVTLLEDDGHDNSEDGESEHFEAETPDEAFYAAAEWVRGQG
jgi:hypothetical protein